MAAVGGLIALVLAPKGASFWIATVLGGIVAAALFVLNDAWNRSLIDALARISGASLTKPVIPERQRDYNVADLTAFMTAASQPEALPNKSALAHYIAPTLLWTDGARVANRGLYGLLSDH